MAEKTHIEWTDATWNPVTGCSKVSAGCKHCYAERDWARLSANPKTRYYGREFTDVRCHAAVLDLPLRWTKPRRIFVNSMSDLFHPDVPDEFIDKVFAIMGACQFHIFQVLTKRPERMLAYFNERWQPAPEWSQRDRHAAVEKKVMEIAGRHISPFVLDTEGETRYDQIEREFYYMEIPDEARFWTEEGLSRFKSASWPFPNVWLGVSIEDQATADERVPLLLQTPAAVRWISAEPLLEDVTIFSLEGPIDVYPEMKSPIDWVVAGGESGPKARPMHLEWARSLRDQCAAAGVPFLFKQWGEYLPAELDECPCGPPAAHWMWADGAPWTTFDGQRGVPLFRRVGKKLAGRLLDGVEHNGYPING